MGKEFVTDSFEILHSFVSHENDLHADWKTKGLCICTRMVIQEKQFLTFSLKNDRIHECQNQD